MELARLQSQPQHLENYIEQAPEANEQDTKTVPLEALSIDELLHVLLLDPYSCGHAKQLALRYSRQLGSLEQATQIYESICKVDNRFETLVDYGLSLYQSERNSEALLILQQALLIANEEDEERLFEIFKTIGNIFVKSGDYFSGEDAYLKAQRIQPLSDTILVNLGTLNIQQSQWDVAIVRFRDAVNLNGLNDKAWVGLGICHQQRGDFDLAWANLEMALECNPLNETALNLACDWAVRDQRETRLLELLRNFVVNDGWNLSLNLSFVWLSWTFGEKRSAGLELERILTTDPTCEAAWQLHEKLRGTT